MKSTQQFEKASLWQADGHVTDLVVCAVADGQVDVVPPLALSHIERCQACGDRLGEAALLSLQITDVLEEHAPARAKAPQAAPLPVRPFAWVFVLGLSGTLASTGGLANVQQGLLDLVQLAVGLLRAVVDVGPVMARALGDSAVPLMSISGVFVILMGWMITRMAPRHAWKGSIG